MISNLLKNHIEAEALGTFGIDLFIGLMQDEPLNAICIYDETGTIVEGTQDYDRDVFGTQIIVRGEYVWASQRMLDLHRAIVGWSVETDGIDVISTHIQTEPASIGRDEKGMAQLTAHYEHDCNIHGNKYRTAI